MYCYPDADTMSGQHVTGYLKRNAELPAWAEYRIYPRTGSTQPYHCLYVPRYNPALDQTPSEAIGLSSEHWYRVRAKRGMVWCFRRLSDAERFLEVVK